MDKVAQVEAKLHKYVAPNYNPLPFVPHHCNGVWITGYQRGNDDLYRVLDMTSTYSALNLGHNHQDITRLKIKRLQLNKPSKTSRGIVMSEEVADFAEALCKACGMEMMIPKNTGTEAFDTAVKTARLWKKTAAGRVGDNSEIIVCAHAFHGRSIGATDASSEPLYRDGFGPFAPPRAFRKIPYGDIEALQRAINRFTAAFIVEPIQAEAGIVMPPYGYLQEAKRVCKENGVLCILDEIQTGLGRTGDFFAWQNEGLDAEPDGILLGKFLGGGEEKISAFVSSRDVLGVLTLGREGSTFGGDPSSCVLGMKALELLTPKLLCHVRNEGMWFMNMLRTIPSPLIKDIRGRGLLIGLELTPEAGGARRFCEALLLEGLLCKETHDDVIRFAPPLIVTREELLWAFRRIERVLKTN
ncbi:MAG: aminotransferase class III-fold pyridoxal phosphate-dependent enzyme [Candidatus Spechtbacteria bacterium]|nr:aminotransferase class III-fold pyridoxal phosphate-dependent enzyme [Candidatus Spechtbacteria bacterium]